jgi:hypothetical protein
MARRVPGLGDDGRVAGGDTAPVLVDAGLDLRVGAEHGLRPPPVDDSLQGRQVKRVIGFDGGRVELSLELRALVGP